jgi:hypothetical protein
MITITQYWLIYVQALQHKAYYYAYMNKTQTQLHKQTKQKRKNTTYVKALIEHRSRILSNCIAKTNSTSILTHKTYCNKRQTEGIWRSKHCWWAKTELDMRMRYVTKCNISFVSMYYYALETYQHLCIPSAVVTHLAEQHSIHVTQNLSCLQTILRTNGNWHFIYM